MRINGQLIFYKLQQSSLLLTCKTLKRRPHTCLMSSTSNFSETVSDEAFGGHKLQNTTSFSQLSRSAVPNQGEREGNGAGQTYHVNLFINLGQLWLCPLTRLWILQGSLSGHKGTPWRPPPRTHQHTLLTSLYPQTHHPQPPSQWGLVKQDVRKPRPQAHCSGESLLSWWLGLEETAAYLLLERLITHV